VWVCVLSGECVCKYAVWCVCMYVCLVSVYVYTIGLVLIVRANCKFA